MIKTLKVISSMIHQAFGERLFIHLSVIVLHCTVCFGPHNKIYRALIIKLSIQISSYEDIIGRYRVTTDIYTHFIKVILYCSLYY